MTRDEIYKIFKAKNLSIREIDKKILCNQLRIEAFKNMAVTANPYGSDISDISECVMELEDEISVLKQLRNESDD